MESPDMVGAAEDIDRMGKYNESKHFIVESNCVQF